MRHLLVNDKLELELWDGNVVDFELIALSTTPPSFNLSASFATNLE